MAEYSRVAKQLAAVRRAWKRTAALSGLAVTCLETLGVLTVAFLIDWIYSPPPMWRCAILAGVVVAVAALLVRHVVRPIAKKISDDQVAMFVEEHNDKFEGSLITATEFAGPAARSEAPAFFIDAVIASAIQRAHQVSIRSILDFRRLRKYGFAALAVLAGYGVMAVFAPDYVTQHMKRVIAPWKVRAEDQRVLDQATLMKMPITFTLSRGHSSILRGSNFELEAVLSRHSDDPVSLNFKSAGTAGNWRVLPMTEIEKLNAFTGTLKDINEDMEFFASSGSHRSETFKISVFDPLVVQSVELRTQYPAYLQLPDKVEVRSENVGIDVAAPEASKVTLRITANRPIVSGQVSLAAIESGDRQQLPVTAEKGQPVAVASFEVKQDGTYEYEIADSVGQKARSSVRGDIRILKDGPPTMEVRRPLNGATPVPIGEVSFLVSATDDLAMAGVEVFYERQFPDASKEPGVPVKTQAGKFPLQLKHLTSGSFPDTTEATGRMLLETLDPPCQPEEIISFYVEGTDRKGQKVVSELQTIAVMHYENWVEADVKPPHEPTFTIQKDIEEYVKMAWQMHQAREKVAKAELAKQCSDIADSMKNESKQFYPFYNPKKIPPDKKHHAHKADEYIAKGYDALKAVNTGDAVADFRVAAAELKICGIGNLDKMQMFSADFNKPGNQKEKELKKLFEKIMVEVAKPPIPQEFLDKLKAAEELKKAAAELEKKQGEIAKKADALAKADLNPDKKDPDKKDPNAKDPDKKDPNAQDPALKNPDAKDPKAKDPNAKDPKANDPNKKDDPQGLAAQQEKVADDARREADKAAKDPKADPNAKAMVGKMEDAVRTMKDATKHMREGKLDEAAAEAEKARKELLKVATGAEQMRQEQLAAAIAQAEKEAGKVLIRQKELTRETQGAATKPADQQEKDLKKLAFRQAQLKTDMAAVKDAVKDLNDWAQKDAKPETAKQIEDSHRQITRGQVEQKMANAVVELTDKKTSEAVGEQKKAEDSLGKVVDSLRKASDSMAADTEAELRRAAAEAAKIDADLKKLGIKVPETQPANQVAGSQPATQQVASKDPNAKDPNAKDPNAKDPNAKDPNAKDPNAKDPLAKDPNAKDPNAKDPLAKDPNAKDPNAKDPNAKDPNAKDPNAKDPLAKDPNAKDPNAKDPNAKEKPLTEAEKKDLAENLAYDLDRFAKHLDNRQFAEKKDREDLKKNTQDSGALAKSLQEDNKKGEELGVLVRRLKNKLEADYQAQLDAKRLMAAQHEECPPAYRHLVDKYYEALSQVKK